MRTFFLSFIFFSLFTYSQNLSVVHIAKKLNFSGDWQVNDSKNRTHQLKNNDILNTYKGSAFYPSDSPYFVGESKTFAHIIIFNECGYQLPHGYDYAKSPISEAKPGYVLQRSGKKRHTMIITEVKKHDIVVVHTNWSGYHRVSTATFPKEWLIKEGFRVYKVGVEQESYRSEYPKRKRGIVKLELVGSPYRKKVFQGRAISHSGPGGEISINEQRSVSNTLSLEYGVESEIVSAKVGFSVTATFSRTLQYSKNITSGKFGSVDVYYVYNTQKFKIYYFDMWGNRVFKGYGEAGKWEGIEFTYIETD